MSSNALVLAINAGSSSLKAALIRGGEISVASFLAERLGTENASIHYSYYYDHGEGDAAAAAAEIQKDDEIPHCNHENALHHILEFLKAHNPTAMEHLVATGHRVVHGGAKFQHATVITESILAEIDSVSHLAPLHNPHNIKGIRSIGKVLPNLPAVAVFDTAFHSTLPLQASLYPLPKSYRDMGIRKYGFHGTSVQYVSEKANRILQQLEPDAPQEQQPPQHSYRARFNMIVCHLGNGASVTAVNDQGQSVETSMGFSPLAGLMMGTRCGSIDPAIVSFAVHAMNKTVDDVLVDLNKESGLKAMTQDHDYDMRSLLQRAKDGHTDAMLAVDMFVYRLVQHIASSLVALPGPVDALVFTAGIGEHSAVIRQRCIQQLQSTILQSLELDHVRNQSNGTATNGVLTKAGSWPVCLCIATDEEVMIAQECLKLILQ